MIETSAERIGRRLQPSDVVLDVGGWNKPFARADWVIDLMPHATRTRAEGGAEERFGADTWVQRDICDHQPWPFSDGQFDFVICSHVLEDIRDPVWVCSELNRVARAGYIEVPSRLEEHSMWVNGEWAGWSHHHWLIDMGEESIDFVFKPHSINGWPPYHLPAPFGTLLTDAERVQSLWWEGGFDYRERIFFDLLEFDAYMAEFVAEAKARLEPRLPSGPRWRERARRLRGRLRRSG